MHKSEFKDIVKRLEKRMAEAKRFQERISERIKEIDVELRAIRKTRNRK